MRLFLTRHGETIENAKDIIQGHLPGQLSDTGKEQARRLADRLKDEQFDIIYASDLARVIDTVEMIAKYHEGTELCLDKALRERNFGDQQGKTKEEVWDEQNLKFHDPVGGETVREFFDRVNGFWQSIKEKHKDDKVLIVSHGGTTIAMTAAITTGAATGMRGVPESTNTGVTIIDITDQGYEVECMNDTSHLTR